MAISTLSPIKTAWSNKEKTIVCVSRPSRNPTKVAFPQLGEREPRRGFHWTEAAGPVNVERSPRRDPAGSPAADTRCKFINHQHGSALVYQTP